MTLKGAYWLKISGVKIFGVIYPSQRQNLLPTMEIITQIFQKNQNFGKKFQNRELFFQNFGNHKGAANDIKGAAASLLVNYENFIFFQECLKLGVYNIKHNLARSSFQFWLSKSASRVTKFPEKNCLG